MIQKLARLYKVLIVAQVDTSDLKSLKFDRWLWLSMERVKLILSVVPPSRKSSPVAFADCCDLKRTIAIDKR